MDNPTTTGREWTPEMDQAAVGFQGQRAESGVMADVPGIISESCVACMECVQRCPEGALWGEVIRDGVLNKALKRLGRRGERELVMSRLARPTKYQDGRETVWFGLFVDAERCNGCCECVEVCGRHDALTMVAATPARRRDDRLVWEFFKASPFTPAEYVYQRRRIELRPERLRPLGVDPGWGLGGMVVAFA